MRKLSIILIMVISVYAKDFTLSKTVADSADAYEGLASSGSSNIAFQNDSIIWFSSGGGLTRTTDFGKSFNSFYKTKNIDDTTNIQLFPTGGIVSMDVLDSTIWISGIYDSTVNGVSENFGGGLSFSKDNGVTWDFINQPQDQEGDDWDLWAGDTMRFFPYPTNYGNTTWDIAVTDEYVYIASYYGGLRRSSDNGETWQRIPLPADGENYLGSEPVDYIINPNDNYNHRAFCVIAYSDTVWVGTAYGINRGIVRKDFIEWTNYNYKNSRISGNWVVDMNRQVYNGKETIWAVTLASDKTGEMNGVSKTSDGGFNWSTTLENIRSYRLSSYDSLVFVSTQKGLFKSLDGNNWARYDAPKEEGGDRILDEKVYDAKVDDRSGQQVLWVATDDGLAKKQLNQTDWDVIRRVISTQDDNQPMFYAYPNPFSPTHQNQLNGEGHVRFQYHLTAPSDVKLEIFNFAMEKIYQQKTFESATGDNALVWNGRDNDGYYPANGTYFCRMTKTAEGKTKSAWTKLIIIK